MTASPSCLNRDSFTPEYAISPFDSLQPAKPGDQLVTDDATGNVSYAMLSIAGDPAVDPAVKARRDEWSETLNPDAIVVSDRLVGNVASGMRSVLTGKATSRNQWGCARSYYSSTDWIGRHRPQRWLDRVPHDARSWPTPSTAAAPNPSLTICSSRAIPRWEMRRRAWRAGTH